MTITRSGMTPEAIEELINQRVEEVLTAHEATRAANALEAENQSQNGNDSGNGNGDNGYGENGNGEKGIVSKPLQLKERKELSRIDKGFERNATVFHISNYPEKSQVKNNDLDAYTQRFQELTMMCTKMVPEEEDRVEKFIGGLLDNIQGNVIAAEPTKLTIKRPNVGGQNVARAYTASNNEKKLYNGLLPLCNKCKLHHEGLCIVRYGKCNKVGHLTWDCKVTISTTSTQRGQVVNQRVVTCYECGGQGHYRSDCPKLKDQNRGNKARNMNGVGEARGKAYVLGRGDANPNSNVVKGTFLLNNHYAFILFDSGADRSFVSTTFRTFLDISPDTLEH
ncbi:reverse transcriptase domain-containing protein [Tanacetum coccineum]